MRLRRQTAAAFALSVAAMIFISRAARADTISESFYATYTAVGMSEETTSGILQFNPSLGTLNSVTETLTGNILFTNTTGTGSYRFSTENLIDTTSSVNQMLNISVLSTGSNIPSGLTGTGYRIEALDLTVSGGLVSSIGPVTDTYIFNYTPAMATTPEPSPLVLAASGFATLLILRRKLLQLSFGR